MYNALECSVIRLDETHRFYTGNLPEKLILSADKFDNLWSERPDEYHKILIHGREVDTPRWQQAFGHDYDYTGRVNYARPLLPVLEPLVSWCQNEIDERLNGVLVNWYDVSLLHYIGKHRDSVKDMIAGCPIVTLSFGGSRTFRLRPWKGAGYQDFQARNGSLFIMPFRTNQAYTHEVLRLKRDEGRRISVTLRGFESRN